MNWWSKNKKIVLLSFAGLLLVVGAVTVLSMMLVAPRTSGQLCTLVGCVGGLNIELAGLPADASYQAILSFPSEKTNTLSCGSNDNSIPFEKSCSTNGAFFSLDPDISPPDEITVTIVLDGKQVSQDFRPVYEKFQPNGENCSPVCYNATIKMNVSP